MKRIIVFIFIFAIFICFIVLNLDKRCDISFGFTTLYDVPIFLSVLTSFTFGMLVTLPMLLLGRIKNQKKEKKEKLPKPSKKAPAINAPDELKKEDSPYGID